MYDMIVMLLSFVFAIAMTHLLSTATDLILARDRVRFSGLQALWMANALLLLLNNWLGYGGLGTVRHWSPGAIVLMFTAAVIQYFTCSTLAIRVAEHGVDMPAYFERHRRVIFSAFAALFVVNIVQNYVFRAEGGQSPDSWIVPDLIILVMTLAMAVAALARTRWMQWAVALALSALEILFLVQYILPA